MTEDDPRSVAVYLPPNTARAIVTLAGGHREPDGGRYVFPDGFWTWMLDEAATHALEDLSRAAAAPETTGVRR
jgi:hypothetical protein